MSRLLVVEDNQDIAEVFVLLLAAAGHDVHAVRDGLAALREAQRWSPDAVVCDIGLPVMDGMEVARRLRKRHGSRVRLVACTGYCDEDTRRRISEAGFDVILTKPAPIDDLLSALEGRRPERRKRPRDQHSGPSQPG